MLDGASSLRLHLIKVPKNVAGESKIAVKICPKGHPQRSVSADFRFYCDSKVGNFKRL